MDRIASGLYTSVLELLGSEVAEGPAGAQKCGVDFDELVSAITKTNRADRSGAADPFRGISFLAISRFRCARKAFKRDDCGTGEASASPVRAIAH